VNHLLRIALFGVLLLATACRPAPPEPTAAPAPAGPPVESPTPDAATAATTHGGEEIKLQLDESFDAAPLLAWQEKQIRAEADKPVYIIRGVDPTMTAYLLMEQLAPSIAPSTPILIKPNLGGFRWFKNGPDDGMIGRVTDVRFVEGVVQYLVQQGSRRITIAEGWGVDDPRHVERMFQTAGYRDLANRYPQVTLVDLNTYGGSGPDNERSKPLPVKLPAGSTLTETLTLPKIYVEHLQHGLVIDVAKLKMHHFPVLTLGMKNLMGVVGFVGRGLPQKNKGLMHPELNPFLNRRAGLTPEQRQKEYREVLDQFAQRLVDIYPAAHPHLTLIDGVLATEGDGFADISSAPLGVALGSYNTVYADVIAARLAGYWDNEELRAATGFAAPPYLPAALDRYYGGTSAARNIRVLGDAAVLSQGWRMRWESLGPGKWPGNLAEKLGGRQIIRAAYLGEQANEADLSSRDFNWPVERMVWIMRDWQGKALPPGVATGVAAGYTDRELVFFFLAHYRELTLREGEIPETDVSDIYRWDTVEVFLDPDPATPQTYLEWEVSPRGERLDLTVDVRTQEFDVSWESGMTGKSDLNRNHRIWLTKLIIPFDRIGAPRAGDVWKANFFRTEGKSPNRLYMAWQPTGTPKPNYHVPDVFGDIIFERP